MQYACGLSSLHDPLFVTIYKKIEQRLPISSDKKSKDTALRGNQVNSPPTGLTPISLMSSLHCHTCIYALYVTELEKRDLITQISEVR